MHDIDMVLALEMQQDDEMETVLNGDGDIIDSLVDQDEERESNQPVDIFNDPIEEGREFFK